MSHSSNDQKEKEDSASPYSRPALIVWDMQYGMAVQSFNFKDVVSNIRFLIDGAHASHVPVIYSQYTGLPYELMNNYLIYWAMKRGMDPKRPRLPEGSHDWQIIEELTPSPDRGDVVLKKHTASLFVGTYFEGILHNLRINSLILTGVSTEIGIETTARHASCLGFIPIIARDAVGSPSKDLHEISLRVMSGMFELETTQNIIQKLQNRMG